MKTLRTIAASYWTALAIGAVTVFLHVRWYTVDKAPGGGFVSGFGAAMVALGVFVGLRPYIRAGVVKLVQAELPAFGGGFYAGGDLVEQHRARVEAERPQVTRDVWAERMIAVAIATLGTLLNGYGPLVARMLHM